MDSTETQPSTACSYCSGCATAPVEHLGGLCPVCAYSMYRRMVEAECVAETAARALAANAVAVGFRCLVLEAERDQACNDLERIRYAVTGLYVTARYDSELAIRDVEATVAGLRAAAGR